MNIKSLSKSIELFTKLAQEKVKSMKPQQKPQENRRVTIYDIVNKKVKLTWHSRNLHNEQHIIFNNDVDCEGVMRKTPTNSGFSVLTNDGKSIGFFQGEYPLERNENKAGSDLSSWTGFDGKNNGDYHLEVVSDTTVAESDAMPDKLDELPVIYYKDKPIGDGFLSKKPVMKYQMWAVVDCSWVNISSKVLEIMGLDSDEIEWKAGGKEGTFYWLFNKYFPNVKLEQI